MLLLPRRILRPCSLPLLLLLLPGLAGSAPAVPEVRNGAQPSGPALTMPMQELWRVGGLDDDENLLGVVTRALTDSEGRLYLLDIQMVEVQVYDRDGNFEHTLGKQGDGPGELRSVSDAIFLPDGTLGLVQPFPGRIVKVDLDGLPAGEVEPGGGDPTEGGFFGIRAAAARGPNIVISGMRISRGENSRTATHFIEPIALDGSEGAAFAEKVTVRDFSQSRLSEKDEFFPHFDGWALGPDGSVVVAPERNAYRLEVHAPDGPLKLVITREYKSLNRTAAELERAKAAMMPRRGPNRGGIEVAMEPTERDILQFHVNPDGRLWVLPSRGAQNQAPGIHSTWDVFDPAGRFERQVSFACPADGQNDRLLFPGGDLVVVVKEYRDALWAFQGRGREDSTAKADDSDAKPLEVICYRIAPVLGRVAE